MRIEGIVMPKAKLGNIKGKIRGQIGRRIKSDPSKTVDSLLDQLGEVDFTEEDDHNFDTKKQDELSQGIAQLIVDIFSQDPLFTATREANITELLRHFDEKDKISARTILTSHLDPNFVPAEPRKVGTVAPAGMEKEDGDELSKLTAAHDKTKKTEEKKVAQPTKTVQPSKPASSAKKSFEHKEHKAAFSSELASALNKPKKTAKGSGAALSAGLPPITKTEAKSPAAKATKTTTELKRLEETGHLKGDHNKQLRILLNEDGNSSKIESALALRESKGKKNSTLSSRVEKIKMAEDRKEVILQLGKIGVEVSNQSAGVILAENLLRKFHDKIMGSNVPESKKQQIDIFLKENWDHIVTHFSKGKKIGDKISKFTQDLDHLELAKAYAEILPTIGLPTNPPPAPLWPKMPSVVREVLTTEATFNSQLKELQEQRRFHHAAMALEEKKHSEKTPETKEAIDKEIAYDKFFLEFVNEPFRQLAEAKNLILDIDSKTQQTTATLRPALEDPSFSQEMEMIVNAATNHTALQQNKSLHKYITETRPIDLYYQTKNKSQSNIDSYLITAAQRIPRYELLLRELISSTPKGAPERTHLRRILKAVQKKAVAVNEILRMPLKASCDSFNKFIIKKLKENGIEVDAKENNILATYKMVSDRSASIPQLNVFKDYLEQFFTSTFGTEEIQQAFRKEKIIAEAIVSLLASVGLAPEHKTAKSKLIDAFNLNTPTLNKIAKKLLDTIPEDEKAVISLTEKLRSIVEKLADPRSGPNKDAIKILKEGDFGLSDEEIQNFSTALKDPKAPIWAMFQPMIESRIENTEATYELKRALINSVALPSPDNTPSSKYTLEAMMVHVSRLTDLAEQVTTAIAETKLSLSPGQKLDLADLLPILPNTGIIPEIDLPEVFKDVIPIIKVYYENASKMIAAITIEKQGLPPLASALTGTPPIVPIIEESKDPKDQLVDTLTAKLQESLELTGPNDASRVAVIKQLLSEKKENLYSLSRNPKIKSSEDYPGSENADIIALVLAKAFTVEKHINIEMLLPQIGIMPKNKDAAAIREIQIDDRTASIRTYVAGLQIAGQRIDTDVASGARPTPTIQPETPIAHPAAPITPSTPPRTEMKESDKDQLLEAAAKNLIGQFSKIDPASAEVKEIIGRLTNKAKPLSDRDIKAITEGLPFRPTLDAGTGKITVKYNEEPTQVAKEIVGSFLSEVENKIIAQQTLAAVPRPEIIDISALAPESPLLTDKEAIEVLRLSAANAITKISQDYNLSSEKTKLAIDELIMEVTDSINIKSPEFIGEIEKMARELDTVMIVNARLQWGSETSLSSMEARRINENFILSVNTIVQKEEASIEAKSKEEQMAKAEKKKEAEIKYDRDLDKALITAIDIHFTEEMKARGITPEGHTNDFLKVKSELLEVKGLTREQKTALFSFFRDTNNAHEMGEYKKYFPKNPPAIQNALQKFYAEKAKALSSVTTAEINKANDALIDAVKSKFPPGLKISDASINKLIEPLIEAMDKVKPFFTVSERRAIAKLLADCNIHRPSFASTPRSQDIIDALSQLAINLDLQVENAKRAVRDISKNKEVIASFDKGYNPIEGLVGTLPGEIRDEVYSAQLHVFCQSLVGKLSSSEISTPDKTKKAIALLLGKKEMSAVYAETSKSIENSFKSMAESYLEVIVDRIQFDTEIKTNLLTPIRETFLQEVKRLNLDSKQLSALCHSMGADKPLDDMIENFRDNKDAFNKVKNAATTFSQQTRAIIRMLPDATSLFGPALGELLVGELLVIARRPITEPELIAILSVLADPGSSFKGADVKEIAADIFSKAADVLLEIEIAKIKDEVRSTLTEMKQDGLIDKLNAIHLPSPPDARKKMDLARDVALGPEAKRVATEVTNFYSAITSVKMRAETNPLLEQALTRVTTRINATYPNLDIQNLIEMSNNLFTKATRDCAPEIVKDLVNYLNRDDLLSDTAVPDAKFANVQTELQAFITTANTLIEQAKLSAVPAMPTVEAAPAPISSDQVILDEWGDFPAPVEEVKLSPALESLKAAAKLAISKISSGDYKLTTKQTNPCIEKIISSIQSALNEGMITPKEIKDIELALNNLSVANAVGKLPPEFLVTVSNTGTGIANAFILDVNKAIADNIAEAKKDAKAEAEANEKDAALSRDEKEKPAPPVVAPVATAKAASAPPVAAPPPPVNQEEKKRGSPMTDSERPAILTGSPVASPEVKSLQANHPIFREYFESVFDATTKNISGMRYDDVADIVMREFNDFCQKIVDVVTKPESDDKPGKQTKKSSQEIQSDIKLIAARLAEHKDRFGIAIDSKDKSIPFIKHEVLRSTYVRDGASLPERYNPSKGKWKYVGPIFLNRDKMYETKSPLSLARAREMAAVFSDVRRKIDAQINPFAMLNLTKLIHATTDAKIPGVLDSKKNPFAPEGEIFLEKIEKLGLNAPALGELHGLIKNGHIPDTMPENFSANKRTYDEIQVIATAYLEQTKKIQDALNEIHESANRIADKTSPEAKITGAEIVKIILQTAERPLTYPEITTIRNQLASLDTETLDKLSSETDVNEISKQIFSLAADKLFSDKIDIIVKQASRHLTAMGAPDLIADITEKANAFFHSTPSKLDLIAQLPLLTTENLNEERFSLEHVKGFNLEAKEAAKSLDQTFASGTTPISDFYNGITATIERAKVNQIFERALRNSVLIKTSQLPEGTDVNSLTLIQAEILDAAKFLPYEGVNKLAKLIKDKSPLTGLDADFDNIIALVNKLQTDEIRIYTESHEAEMKSLKPVLDAYIDSLKKSYFDKGVQLDDKNIALIKSEFLQQVIIKPPKSLNFITEGLRSSNANVPKEISGLIKNQINKRLKEHFIKAIRPDSAQLLQMQSTQLKQSDVKYTPNYSQVLNTVFEHEYVQKTQDKQRRNYFTYEDVYLLTHDKELKDFLLKQFIQSIDAAFAPNKPTRGQMELIAKTLKGGSSGDLNLPPAKNAFSSIIQGISSIQSGQIITAINGLEKKINDALTKPTTKILKDLISGFAIRDAMYDFPEDKDKESRATRQVVYQSIGEALLNDIEKSRLEPHQKISLLSVIRDVIYLPPSLKINFPETLDEAKAAKDINGVLVFNFPENFTEELYGKTRVILQNYSAAIQNVINPQVVASVSLPDVPVVASLDGKEKPVEATITIPPHAVVASDMPAPEGAKQGELPEVVASPSAAAASDEKFEEKFPTPSALHPLFKAISETASARLKKNHPKISEDAITLSFSEPFEEFSKNPALSKLNQESLQALTSMVNESPDNKLDKKDAEEKFGGNAADIIGAVEKFYTELDEEAQQIAVDEASMDLAISEEEKQQQLLQDSALLEADAPLRKIALAELRLALKSIVAPAKKQLEGIPDAVTYTGKLDGAIYKFFTSINNNFSDNAIDIEGVIDVLAPLTSEQIKSITAVINRHEEYQEAPDEIETLPGLDPAAPDADVLLENINSSIYNFYTSVQDVMAEALLEQQASEVMAPPPVVTSPDPELIDALKQVARAKAEAKGVVMSSVMSSEEIDLLVQDIFTPENSPEPTDQRKIAEILRSNFTSLPEAKLREIVTIGGNTIDALKTAYELMDANITLAVNSNVDLKQSLTEKAKEFSSALHESVRGDFDAKFSPSQIDSFLKEMNALSVDDKIILTRYISTNGFELPLKPIVRMSDGKAAEVSTALTMLNEAFIKARSEYASSAIVTAITSVVTIAKDQIADQTESKRSIQPAKIDDAKSLFINTIDSANLSISDKSTLVSFISSEKLETYIRNSNVETMGNTSLAAISALETFYTTVGDIVAKVRPTFSPDEELTSVLKQVIRAKAEAKGVVIAPETIADTLKIFTITSVPDDRRRELATLLRSDPSAELPTVKLNNADFSAETRESLNEFYAHIDLTIKETTLANEALKNTLEDQVKKYSSGLHEFVKADFIDCFAPTIEEFLKDVEALSATDKTALQKHISANGFKLPFDQIDGITDANPDVAVDALTKLNKALIQARLDGALSSIVSGYEEKSVSKIFEEHYEALFRNLGTLPTPLTIEEKQNLSTALLPAIYRAYDKAKLKSSDFRPEIIAAIDQFYLALNKQIDSVLVPAKTQPTFIPFLLDYSRLIPATAEREQALKILHEVDRLHKAGHEKVGITLSVSDKQTANIRDKYEHGIPITGTGTKTEEPHLRGQVGVIQTVETLLEDPAYQHLKGKFQILPITTCQANLSSPPERLNTTDELLDKDLLGIDKFLTEGGAVLGWQNQNTVATDSPYAIGGGTVKLSADHNKKIQDGLKHFAATYAPAPVNTLRDSARAVVNFHRNLISTIEPDSKTFETSYDTFIASINSLELPEKELSSLSEHLSMNHSAPGQQFAPTLQNSDKLADIKIAVNVFYSELNKIALAKATLSLSVKYVSDLVALSLPPTEYKAYQLRLDEAFRNFKDFSAQFLKDGFTNDWIQHLLADTIPSAGHPAADAIKTLYTSVASILEEAKAMKSVAPKVEAKAPATARAKATPKPFKAAPTFSGRPAEIPNLINHNKSLLIQIGALFRAQGLIKQYEENYFNDIENIEINLQSIKNYLNTRDTTHPTVIRDLADIEKALTMCHELATQIEAKQKIKSDHGGVRTFKKGELILPSFTEDKPVIIQIKDGQDWWQAYAAHIGTPDAKKPSPSHLTLHSGASIEGLDHWTENVDQAHMRLSTMVLDKADAESNVHILTHIDVAPEQGITTHVVKLDPRLETTHVYQQALMRALSDRTISGLDRKEIPVICNVLADYLSKQNPKKYPDDKDAIKAFFSSSTAKDLLVKNGVSVSTVGSVIGLFTNSATSGKLADILSNGYKDFFDPSSPRNTSPALKELAQTNRDKVRSIAITAVEDFIATGQDITEEPLRITSAWSPEVVKEIMVYCELRNRFAPPSERIDYRNDSGYPINLSHTPRRTLTAGKMESAPSIMDTEVHKLNTDLNTISAKPKHPLHHLVTTKLPYSLSDATSRRNAGVIQSARIMPHSGLYKKEKKVLDDKMKAGGGGPATPPISPRGRRGS